MQQLHEELLDTELLQEMPRLISPLEGHVLNKRSINEKFRRPPGIE